MKYLMGQRPGSYNAPRVLRGSLGEEREFARPAVAANVAALAPVSRVVEEVPPVVTQVVPAEMPIIPEPRAVEQPEQFVVPAEA